MITKTPSFQTSDGTPFATLEQAQRYEIASLFDIVLAPGTVETIVSNSEKVVAILRATGRKPRERKKKAGRPKGSKGKVAATGNGEAATL